MPNFTYQIPDEKKYYQHLIDYLNNQGNTASADLIDSIDLIDIVKDSKISISDKSTFSHERWNAHYTEITFNLSSEEKLGKINDTVKSELKRICNFLIPDDTGLDVINIEFILNKDEISLVSDLNEISERLSNAGKSSSLPNDMLEKAEEMSESYLYMFSIENYIRLFIHKVATDNYGDNYFNRLSVPKSIQNSITSRKSQERKNKWLSVREDSQLFYLDFKDLSDLITNNWSIFKGFFPDQAWISSKINELGNCRNLIAHNSYLGSHERDIIRVNFQSLIRQISIKSITKKSS